MSLTRYLLNFAYIGTGFR